MSLTALLKLAALFGYDKEKLIAIVKEEGIEQGERVLKAFVSRRLEKAVPAALENLKDKAPLDGQPKKDKDGVVMTDVEYLCHELTYLFCKSVIKKSGFGIDYARDIYYPKIVSRVSGSTPEEVAASTIIALVEQVW